MKTLTTVKAWILICSIISVSSATDHTSSQHDVSHHGDSTPKNLQNTIIPFGIQIPENVLSTQDVACISADSNIFEIMNKAQDSCNGTDMRCTFYHFVNHGYQNIGTLDIDKELFDDLLMKFDNWLLTAEKIEKNDEPLDRKTKEDTFLDTASINVNGSYSIEEQIKNSTNVSETEDVHNIGNVDHNTNDSDDDKIVNTHHIKNVYDTHHRNHHHKSKNGNHIKLVPEYNNDHKYFEVFISKDNETGKPRTIYVEVDKEKNQFVLLDEEIDKKLNGIKPIKIELDELSEIVDTAFNNIAKSSNHTQHIYHSNDDDRVMSSDVNTYSAMDEDTTNLDKDVREPTQNILNPSIFNINTNQPLIPDNTTGNIMKTVNVSKNLVAPNKYTNPAKSDVESQIDSTTDEIPNDHLVLLESSNNETDIYQTGFDEEAPLDTIEFNENNTNLDLKLDNLEYSPENVIDNSTENYELSTEHDNVTFYDESFIQPEENNVNSIDIDFDDTHDISSSETTHLNEYFSQTEKHVQGNKLKSTPTIYTEPKLTPSPTTGMSDYNSPQLDAIPSENRQGYIDLKEHSPAPGIPLSSYTNVPIMGKDLAKVVETDDHLQSSFPVYATLDYAGASQKTPLDSDFEHPTISSYKSPSDSDFEHQTTGPEIFQHTSPIFPTPRIESAAPNFLYTSPVFPSPPVECVVRLNKGSKYSPLNFGFSWLPSFSRIEELRLPYAVNASPQESILQLSMQKNKQLTDSICPEPSSLDHTIPAEDPRLFLTVPLLSVDGQKPSLTTVPYHLEGNVPMPPKHVLPSTLDLPKSFTDSGRIPTTYELSETPLSVKPYSPKDSVNSPCPMQQIEPFLQPTKPNLMDFGLIKHSPFDNKSKETMIPCTTNRNRYPYTSTPCFANPYLRPPQIRPPYLEPLLPVTLLQPASKISTLDSLPTSLDQSYPYINGDYRQETNQPISLLQNSPFPPLSPLLLGPGFVSNTLPCQNLWNNIPNLPCSILPDQNIRNYTPIVSNYITPSAVLQQNQILKPSLSKSVPCSALEEPYPIKNVLEKTPPSHMLYLTPVQMDLNPSLALERDLQSLSLKYGIPLSKILKSLETEISDAHSKTTGPTGELPYSNLVHDSSSTSKPISTKTNAAFDDENRIGNRESLLESELSNLVPLESSLIGPHLELESSLMLESNDFQGNTTSYSSFKNQTTNVIHDTHDSSLIGAHLSTSSTSNFVLSDENRTANEMILSESDISNSILLDSSLTGPHLEIGSPPIVLDSNNSHSDILASQIEEPITVSSQIEQKLNLNRPANFLDSSLIGSHLPSLSPVRPLLSNEIQNINDMIPLETDLTDFTPLDSSVIHTQDGLVNQLDLTGILQHEETGVTLSAANTSPDLHKPLEYLPTNLAQEELLFKSDSSGLIPLDSSLIGPELKLGSSPIITDSLEDKTVPLVSKDSIVKIDKVEELENIILPPSLLPTLLKKTVKADTNLNINTQDTKLNEQLNELSVDTNVELTSSSSFKETDFKIVEPIPELPSLIDESKPLLTKDSKTFKHKSKSSDITHVVDSETILDSSLTGTSILHKLETPEISASLDSSIHLDSSIIGPSIIQEIDSREISPIIDSESSLAHTTLNQNKKPSEILTVTDSSIEFQSSFKDLDSSLEGSHSHLLTVPFSSDEIQMINKELQSKSDSANLVPLDSSLIGPHVDFESELEQSEISRYQKPESFLTSANPEVSETTDFLSSDLVKGVSPPEPITVPSVCASDLEELLSNFTNAITKAQLSPSELKPCDKLLSSIAKISSDNYVLPSCKDLQTLTLNTLLNTPLSLQDELASEFSPITPTYPAQEFSPVESLTNGLGSNYFPTPTTMVESRPYTQGVPQIPITPYSQFVQMKPLTDRNWLGPTNIQNILQSSPSFRPVPGNTPIPFNSNVLPVTSEDLKSLLDLASYSKIYSPLSIPNMYSSGNAIAPSSEWTKSSYVLPPNKYIPVLPKKHSSVLPLECTIANVEYNPIQVDDIMPLINENSLELLKDMSILPFIQSALRPNIPVFEKGEIVSPSLLKTVPILDSNFIQTGPLLPVPITNPLVPSSIYNPKIRLNNLQDLPYMKQTPNIILPCNLQPHSNTPLHLQFSEIIGPAPNLVTLPTESSKALLQQLLSKPCLESPIILPSSSLDTMLQLQTASNELNSVPSKLPPEYFTPISPTYKTMLSNAFTSPILPIYASPLSVSFAKPISPPCNSIPLNIPYVDSLLTLIPLSINPCTAKPLTPKYPSPVMPLKITPLSDFPHPPTVPHNRPIPSVNPYTPSHTYSSPYLPVDPSPIPTDTSPGSPMAMGKLPAAMTSPISPVVYEPLLSPYVSPVPKSLTNLELPAYSSPLTPIFLSKLAPTSTGLLSPAHLSPTNSYPSLPAPMNTQRRPSNVLTPASKTPISPVSSSLSSSDTPLSLNPKIIPPEIKSRQLNTLPISNALNPLLNANQWLQINSNTPLQSYPTHVSKPLPSSFSNSQIQQYIPSEHALESNLLTSPLTEDIPSYDAIEESAYTYSNDIDDKYYAEPSLKYPLESLSYTLAPEEIAETLPPEDFIKLEDLTPSATVNNRAIEPSLQTKSYQHHLLTPYTPVHGKPLSKPRPDPQLLLPSSFTESIPQNIYDNKPLVPSSNPLNHPVSQPTSILSSPLLKPLTPLTFAPNFPITSALLPRSCMVSLYNKLPMNEQLQPLSSSPYYSIPSQDMSLPPIYPTGIRNILSPQVTPGFSQVPTNTPFVPVSSQMGLPISQPLTSPYILDSYIQLPSTHYEPKSKTLTSQGSLVKPSSNPHYNQYVEPIISHNPPLAMPISPQYITPLSPNASLKKPLISPQYMSSKLPAPTTLQDSLPLKEAPIHHQPYIPQTTTLTSSAKSIFNSPPVTSPYTVLPSINMVEPVSADLSRLSSNSTPQHSLPSLSLPVSKHSPIISYSNHPSRISPHISKQALTNQIIPSSLFMSSGLQTPANKLSSPYNIPRYSSPSPFLTDPLDTVPYYTPMDTTAIQQNILKPISSLTNIQYTDPLSSQPLQPTDFYQIKPVSNVQFTTKPQPDLSPVPVQYASPSSAPIYTSLPLGTVPYRQINKFSTPQYSLPSAPINDSPIHSSSLIRNPFLNPDFKPITEVPSYPVPKNIISSSTLTPSESILLSNLRPVDISQDPFESYSPLSSSYLLKPLAKRLPQESRQYQPHKISSNSQYVSQLPTESVPELLQSTSPLLKNSLVKPLSKNFQYNAPLLPMRFSNTNTALPEDFPIEAVPSVISPDIALSNYLPSDSSNHKYSGPSSLESKIPEIVTPINSSSITPYSILKSQFNKHFKSPVTTLANMPLYSNYDILDSPPKLPVRANLINTAKPVEVSATSALESSPLSLDSLDTEMIQEIEPYELMPGLKDRLPALPTGLDQQRQLHTASTSKYLATPQPTKTLPSSKYKTSRPRPSFSIPSVIPEEAELIDTTDFGSLSQIKSEPLIADYIPSDRQATKPNTPSNIAEPDILQLSPYTTLLNTDFLFPTNKEVPPKLQTPRYSNQILQPSPTYLSPQEYKDLIQGPSPSQASSSSPSVLSPTNTEPQLVTNPLTGRPRPQTPFYNPMSITPENWLQSPTFAKSLPFHEKHTTPEKETIQTLLNKYRPANNITPQGNNYPYEPKSTIPEVPLKFDFIKPVNPLLKSKEPYTEHIEDLKSNEDNYDEPDLDNVSLDEKPPNSFESKSFTKTLPDIIKDLSIPNYNYKAQRPQKLSKSDHFYANNHIGKGSQVYTVPTYNTLPFSSPIGVKSPATAVSPEIFKDFTDIPTKHFGSVPQLDTISLPSEFYPKMTESPKNIPITNSYPQNYLNSYSKYTSEMKSPDKAIEIADTFEMTPISNTPYNNIDDIKYSGYKTYQIPFFKSPQTPHNLGTPTRIYSPAVVTYPTPIPAVKPLKVHRPPSLPNFYSPTETEPLISQYQTPTKMATPLQTKLGLDFLQKSPELNEYNPIEDIPISVDNINEDNELKTSLINYINKRQDVKNNLINNNAELTIPIGNVAITRKEPYNSNTIETNNPSIGLRVWKSNIKIAEAELKLKFKDLSVNNFMPIVNNLDKYDMEEIRKIVKRYIDEKYGSHIEINEPYIIDNRYTIIKDFDHNAVDNKYNLLWPTNYV